MRIAVTWLAGTSLIALVGVSSCKDDETGTGPVVDAGTIDGATTSDGSTPTDGGSSGDDAAPTGDCSGADVATAQTLAKMLGAWKWSGSIENGTEQPISECDARIGYNIGPDSASPDYAQCAVARGAIIPLRGGVYATTATGCTDVACSDLGILMKSSESAAVYALGPDGKTTGSPAFYFSPIASVSMGEMNLAQSNVPGSLSNAKRLVRYAGVPSCTK